MVGIAIAIGKLALCTDRRIIVKARRSTASYCELYLLRCVKRHAFMLQAPSYPAVVTLQGAHGSR